MQSSSDPIRRKPFHAYLLILLLICGESSLCLGQNMGKKWDEIVDKKIVNREGVTLGYVRDTAIDLENGRYVGVIASVNGGFLGLGAKRVLVPAFALKVANIPRTLFLDMDAARFSAAPPFARSDMLGVPSVGRLADLYRYYGEEPYFTTSLSATSAGGDMRPHLGFIQLGSRILLMPVDNLEDKQIGWVIGLRGLVLGNEPFKGVVIMPTNSRGEGDYKIVPPQTLRYNERHTRLRFNDVQPLVSKGADMIVDDTGHYWEAPPAHPDDPPPPLAQGHSLKDQAITTSILEAIRADPSLSNYGKAIEVGTVGGKTTVRGRVVSPQGHDHVLAYAIKAAGAGNVTDLLAVQSPSGDNPAQAR